MDQIQNMRCTEFRTETLMKMLYIYLYVKFFKCEILKIK